jgi:hypothetical protein
VALELIGGEVAEELHASEAFDECEALGHQAFQFDRTDLRAVLFRLAALLRVLIVVELALHAVTSAVEEVDGRPQQVLEVGFEARVTECAISASKMSATAPLTALACGNGRGSGSS